MSIQLTNLKLDSDSVKAAMFTAKRPSFDLPSEFEAGFSVNLDVDWMMMMMEKRVLPG